MNHCPACGTALATDAKFCSECGSAVSEVLDEDDAQESVPTYKVFTKRYLAYLALVGLLAIGGGFAVTRGSGDGKSAYSHCLENYKDDRTLTSEDKADLCRLETSGIAGETEGYEEQPTTCLEWKTNYNHISRPGGGWDRVPTGQTCVRTG